MNDEIKELIRDCNELLNDEFFTLNNIEITRHELNLLLDYITNLQEQLHQASLNIQELTERDIECPSWCDKLTNLQQENEKLKEHKEYYKNETKRLGKLFYITKEENIKLEEAQKNFEKQFIKEMNYKSRIEKAVEYIENNTRWFDSEYASVYGELCNCAGANANRLEVVINSCNLLDVLNGRSDE